MILEYQLSNGRFIECGLREEEFLSRAMRSNGLPRHEIIARLQAGEELWHDNDCWHGKIRARPAQKPQSAPLPPAMSGQLWEECERCGREPIYMPLHLCEHCWPKG